MAAAHFLPHSIPHFLFRARKGREEGKGGRAIHSKLCRWGMFLVQELLLPRPTAQDKTDPFLF